MGMVLRMNGQELLMDWTEGTRRSKESKMPSLLRATETNELPLGGQERREEKP